MAVTYSQANGFFDYVSKSANQIDYDYDSIIDYDDTGSRWDISSFLMRKENSIKVGSPEFYTWEGEYQTRIATVNGAVTTADTSIVVDSADGLRAGDLLHVASAGGVGQHVRITSISTLTLTVTRESAAGATIADGAELQILYNLGSETASTSVQASFMYPNRVTNRVSLVRRAFEWSETEDATDLRTDGSSSREKAEQARVEFRKDMAHNAWASLSTSTSATGLISSKGILPQLAGNSSALIISAGGALAYSDITDLADGLMEFSDTRQYMVFCGTKALKGLAVLGATSSTYQTTPKDNVYGFKGQAMQAGDMTFMFKFERVFKELGAVYNAYAVALSLENIKFAHLGAKGKFRISPNIEADRGGEIRKTQIRAQVGVKMQHIKRHGIIHGLT